MPDHPKSSAAFFRSQKAFPGGVNSPARACRSVGVDPVFAKGGVGAVVHDLDGNRYLDYVGAFGPMILGHGHPAVIEAMRAQIELGWSFGMPTDVESDLAEVIIAATPSIERMRFVSSGTEATMSALRLARGATGRPRIIKLEGCYHGHADQLLVKAGSGLMTLGTPDSAGVAPATAADTLVAPYNDLAAVERLLVANPDQVAALILEPVVGNMGVVPPEPGYLEGLRKLTSAHGALLVFDEVMTGFRVAWGSSQARFGVTPDITCLGKVIGGGMPIGAYGASSALMRHISPEGAVYQAGTNSGNPVCMAAGLATLAALSDGRAYVHLEAMGAQLEAGLRQALEDIGVPGTVQRVGSMITLFFTAQMGAPVRRLADVPASAPARFGAFFRAMRDAGVLLPPSQYEAWFISAAHTSSDIEYTIGAAREALATA